MFFTPLESIVETIIFHMLSFLCNVSHLKRSRAYKTGEILLQKGEQFFPYPLSKGVAHAGKETILKRLVAA